MFRAVPTISSKGVPLSEMSRSGVTPFDTVGMGSGTFPELSGPMTRSSCSIKNRSIFFSYNYTKITKYRLKWSVMGSSGGYAIIPESTWMPATHQVVIVGPSSDPSWDPEVVFCPLPHTPVQSQYIGRIWDEPGHTVLFACGTLRMPGQGAGESRLHST